eukprot:78831_1
MGACLQASEPTTDTDASDATEIASLIQTDIKNTYTFGNAIGVGASCTVVEAIKKDNPYEKVAIKIMTKGGNRKRMYTREVSILTQLSAHDGILPFIGHGEDRTHYYIITAFFSGGELFDRICSDDEKYKITERMAVKFILNMLQAVKHCHDNQIVHRDLKPENFVFANADLDSKLILIDFGTSIRVTDDQTYNDIVGTPDYMSPECAARALERNDCQVMTGEIWKKSDVWSMGIILYITTTGMAPFRGDTTTAILQSLCDKPLRFPHEDVRYHNKLQLSELFQDFMRKVLNKDAHKRLSIEEAIAHPWVQGMEATDYLLNKHALADLKQFHYNNRLKAQVTRVLSAAAKAAPSQEVLEHFKRLDANENGVLELNELTQLLLDMGYVGKTAEEEAVKMMEAADLNKDGVIDLNEFMDLWYRKALKTNDLYIHRVFKVFDKNGDGVLDTKDLHDLFYADEKDNAGDEDALTHARTLRRMIREVDTSGDGLINFNEFKTAMKEDIEAGKYDMLLTPACD